MPGERSETMRSQSMNHFTNKSGYNSIRSQPTWVFKASQPHAKYNPVGAYFTSYPPTEPDLSERIFVPKEKLAFVFMFEDVGDLLPLPGGRGRLRRIFYSPDDYKVPKERQQYSGETDAVLAHTEGT